MSTWRIILEDLDGDDAELEIRPGEQGDRTVLISTTSELRVNVDELYEAAKKVNHYENL